MLTFCSSRCRSMPVTLTWLGSTNPANIPIPILPRRSSRCPAVFTISSRSNSVAAAAASPRKQRRSWSVSYRMPRRQEGLIAKRIALETVLSSICMKNNLDFPMPWFRRPERQHILSMYPAARHREQLDRNPLFALDMLIKKLGENAYL